MFPIKFSLLIKKKWNDLDKTEGNKKPLKF